MFGSEAQHRRLVFHDQRPLAVSARLGRSPSLPLVAPGLPGHFGPPRSCPGSSRGTWRFGAGDGIRTRDILPAELLPLGAERVISDQRPATRPYRLAPHKPSLLREPPTGPQVCHAVLRVTRPDRAIEWRDHRPNWEGRRERGDLGTHGDGSSGLCHVRLRRASGDTGSGVGRRPG